MRSFRPLDGVALGKSARDGPVRVAAGANNIWDDLAATNRLSLDIAVPVGERWLVQVGASGYIQGSSAPTYQIGAGIVFSGAKTWAPIQDASGPDRFKEVTDINAVNDLMYVGGALSGQMWLPSGLTRVTWSVIRNSGTLSVGRRSLSVLPVLAA